MMSCINIRVSALISQLEKDHSMIETRRLKNDVFIVFKTVFKTVEKYAFFITFSLKFWKIPTELLIFGKFASQLSQSFSMWSR